MHETVIRLCQSMQFLYLVVDFDSFQLFAACITFLSSLVVVYVYNVLSTSSGTVLPGNTLDHFIGNACSQDEDEDDGHKLQTQRQSEGAVTTGQY